MTLDPVVARDALMRSIRAFFHAREYLEVETPIRIEAPCMELHIDAEPSGRRYLRTSPELFHKQLLAKGYAKIFEIGKCFRRNESGPLHHPEYTMLEWYCAQADYMDLLQETKQLIAACWPEFIGAWRTMTVSEAFMKYAGWDPVGQYDEDRFDLDLIEKVEPAFRKLGGAVVLMDYPREAAALARLKPDNPLIAERWELYINGIELANAYSELNDPVEQLQRFQECAERRKTLDKDVYAIDKDFIDALRAMPPAGGVALGLDRLLMLMAGETSLDSIISFRQGN